MLQKFLSFVTVLVLVSFIVVKSSNPDGDEVRKVRYKRDYLLGFKDVIRKAKQMFWSHHPNGSEAIPDDIDNAILEAFTPERYEELDDEFGLKYDDANETISHPSYDPFAGHPRELRYALMRDDELEHSDNLLVRDRKHWYIREPHSMAPEIQRVEVRGYAKGHQRNYFARTEDGIWHKFERVPKEFVNYLSELPMHVDMTELIFNYTDWLAVLSTNNHRYYLKLVRLVDDRNGSISCIDEHGNVHTYKSERMFTRLRSYVNSLPMYRGLVMDSFRRTPDVIEELRDYLKTKKNYLPDYMLHEANGLWYIVDDSMIIARGCNSSYIPNGEVVVETANGNWHHLAYTPNGLRQYLKHLPITYYSHNLLSDKASWYARASGDRCHKIVRKGLADNDQVHAVSEGGDWHVYYNRSLLNKVREHFYSMNDPSVVPNTTKMSQDFPHLETPVHGLEDGFP